MICKDVCLVVFQFWEMPPFLFVFGGSSNSRRTSAVEDATPARTASVDLDHGCKDNA